MSAKVAVVDDDQEMLDLLALVLTPTSSSYCIT